MATVSENVTQGLAGAHGQHLHHARSFHIGDRFSTNNHSVIGHEHDVRVCEGAADPLAFFVIQSQSAILRVVANARRQKGY